MVFGNEFENIQNDYSELFTDMRKKTLTHQEILKVKARNTLKETSEVSSKDEKSDNSSSGYRKRRFQVVLSKDELEDLNT